MTHNLPNFVFLGPDKAGSTWIYRVLATHPQCFLPRAKELFFFDQYYGRGLEWYASHYRRALPDHRVLADISHDYLFSHVAAKRLRSTLPQAQLMVCLREPVDRAFSSYLYMLRQGRLSCSFETALVLTTELIDHSTYIKHLIPYLREFQREQIYISVFDDLKEQPSRFARHLFQYLSIEPIELPDSLLDPVLPAARARDVQLAAGLRGLGRRIRDLGFPGIVNVVKSSQIVERALYVPYGTARPIISAETRMALMEVFRESVKALDSTLGLSLEERWGYA